LGTSFSEIIIRYMFKHYSWITTSSLSPALDHMILSCKWLFPWLDLFFSNPKKWK
jgi:hypothetical protein